MIIRRFSQLLQAYHTLGAGDAYIGQVPFSHLRAAMLIDLESRGVRLLPTATAHMLNASKAAQAFVLLPWMLPNTFVISRRKELLDAVSQYQRQGICSAVTKSDRLHCGHGVRRWSDLEVLYNCTCMEKDVYPFVLQPYIEAFTDVRVILVGEFCEAYRRINPHGFRMNLAAGGQSKPFALSADQQVICRRILERSRMPYAHIDLMITPDGCCYLSEIRLNGGIHGARISRGSLEAIKDKYLDKLAHQNPEPGAHSPQGVLNDAQKEWKEGE